MAEVHPLRTARERHNLSQKALAQETGLSVRTIKRAEQGESIHPSSRKILCHYFNKLPWELGLLKEAEEGPSETQAWENAMNILRRKLLTETVTAAGAALLLPQTNIDILERLSTTLKKPSLIDAVTLTHLEAQMPGYWQLLPDVVGVSSPSLLNCVEIRLKTLLRFLAALHDALAERRLWVMVGELSQIGGHMAFDGRNYPLAAAYYRAAINAGRQASHDTLTAVALTRMSFLPTYEQHPERALPYLEEARRLAQRGGTPTTCAWIAAVEAEAQASLGNTHNCQRALERAEQADKQAPTSEDDPYRTGFDSAKLRGYKGTCYLRIQRPEEALTALHGSLALLRGTKRVRYQSIVLTDIARAYGQQGAQDEAYTYVNQALTFTQQTRSRNILQRILEFGAHLPKRHPVANILEAQIDSLDWYVPEERPFHSAGKLPAR